MKIAWFAAILTSGLINSTMATTCTCSVERIYRHIVPKGKNEVGNHPSHDATLTADFHVVKT